MFEFVAVPFLLAVLLMTISFCLGLYVGYNRAADHLADYFIMMTIKKIGEIFKKHGLIEVFNKLMEEEVEIIKKEK